MSNLTMTPTDPRASLWRGLSLAKKIAFTTSGVVSALVILTLVVLNTSITDAIELKVRADLAGSKVTFESFLKERFETLFINAGIIADTPRFKSLLETQGIDHDTVLDSLCELQKIVQCDLLTVTDAGGKTLARVSHPFWHGDDLSGEPGVASALAGRPRASLHSDGSKLYQVVSLPVVTNGVIQGTLTAGFVIDHAFVERFREMTSSGLGLVFGGKVIVSSGEGTEKSDFEVIAARFGPQLDEETAVTQPVALEVSGQTLLALVAPFGPIYGSDDAFYVIKISLTRAVAFYTERIRPTLVLLGLLAILVAALAAIIVSRKITAPLLRLTFAAGEYARGNLKHRVATPSGDEVGVLGTAFNRMASDLSVTTNGLVAARDELESKVEERTRELADTNQRLQSGVTKLEQKNREIMLLSEMDDVLQACGSVEELYSIAGRLMQRIFPGWSGAISAIRPNAQPLEVAVSWGQPVFRANFFMPQECVALRLGRMHFVERLGAAMILCRHFKDPMPRAFVCVPLVATKTTFGALHLCPPESESMNEDRQRFIGTIARHISLALANLMLREKLQAESIRDPLTGLYNRRYMEEALETEIVRARRNSRRIGIVMMDIDRFKIVNDREGHDAGDMLLCTLANHLTERLRGGDILCRYGGEEFMLILPDVTADSLRVKAVELRQSLKTLKWGVNGIAPAAISMSYGLAMYPDNGTDGKTLMRAADQALYQSKTNGRDCIYFALAQGGASRVST